jgi:RNA polymerase-binding transcription factor DksA
MADIVDDAQEGIELVSQLGAQQAAEHMRGHGSEWCEGCGEDLSAERRTAAKWAIRCVPCQSRFELATQGVRRG